MLDVDRWAELRREHFVRGVAIKELVRRTGCRGTRSGRRCGLTSREPGPRGGRHGSKDWHFWPDLSSSQARRKRASDPCREASCYSKACEARGVRPAQTGRPGKEPRFALAVRANTTESETGASTIEAVARALAQVELSDDRSVV